MTQFRCILPTAIAYTSTKTTDHTDIHYNSGPSRGLNEVCDEHHRWQLVNLGTNWQNCRCLPGKLSIGTFRADGKDLVGSEHLGYAGECVIYIYMDLGSSLRSENQLFQGLYQQ